MTDHYALVRALVWTLISRRASGKDGPVAKRFRMEIRPKYGLYMLQARYNQGFLTERVILFYSLWADLWPLVLLARQVIEI